MTVVERAKELKAESSEDLEDKDADEDGRSPSYKSDVGISILTIV